MKKAYTFNDVNIVPKFSLVNSRSECITKVNFCGVNLDIPLVPSNMSAIVGYDMMKTMALNGSVAIMHRFNGFYEVLENFTRFAIHGHGEYLPFAVSVGVNNTAEELEKIYEICHYPPNFVVIDVAHGHHRKVYKAIKVCREHVDDMFIVAGNVATADGAITLADWGADAIKVGIGNGSLCETRIRTGVGIPQLTAIMDVAEALDKRDMGDVQIMADGGVETPGDVAKAIAAGADVVMSGNFFAGTKETPLPLMQSGDWRSPTLYKQYMGSASYAAKAENGSPTVNIEGNSKVIPYRGSCIRILEEVKSGLKSSMSYVGAYTLKEFPSKAEFVVVTPNGTREATPYLLG